MIAPFLAILLLAGPLPAQAPPPPAAAPALARTLARPDLVLHYTDFGQGEPVLVLMGGPGMAAAPMEPVARMIAKRGRAILPDQRGTGQSIPAEAKAITLDATVEDFEALRQHLGIPRWTVLGASWGGMLALDYAAKRPGSIKGLVLVGSGGPSWAGGGLYAQNRQPRMSADDRAAEAYWSRPEVVARDPDRAAVESMRAMIPAALFDRTRAVEFIAYLRPGKACYNTEAAGLLARDFGRGAAARTEALRKVEIPALILHGRQDPFPEAIARDNHALLKGSRLVWIDRCGHMPWLDQPEAMENALFAFLFPQPAQP